MTFDEALQILADELGLHKPVLKRFANEWDGSLHPKQTGEHPNVHLTDRKILYALIRATKPERVLESGTNDGEGANVILAALKKNKNGGELVTVDIADHGGRHIAPEYENVEVVRQDIVEFVAQFPTANRTPFDFIYDDSSHEVHTVRVIYEHLHLLAHPECVVISHDVATGVGDAIRTGIKDAGLPPLPEVAPDDSLGYAVYRYNGKYGPPK